MRQQTLREPLAFAGVGLHTGVDANLRLLPADGGNGRTFRLGGGVAFPALAEYVVDTRRATVLGHGGATVSTIEHVMSALLAMEVDNVTLEVDGPEIPVMDGSSAVFCDAIARAGLVPQEACRAPFAIDRPFVFTDGDAVLVVAPSDRLRVRFAVDYAPPVGSQFIDTTVDAGSYVRDIAPARTFGYLHEVEALLDAGLARGGSLDNALVFAPDGPLTPLRWANEVVRHKVLDLLGDFSLLGGHPQLDIVAVKSGHRLHARAVTALRAAYPPRPAALGASA